MSDEWTPASGASPVPPSRPPRPPSSSPDDGIPSLAIAAGLVAALLGGGLWAAIAI